MKKKRQHSTHETLLRRYHADVRKLKKICEDCDIKLYTYSNAPDDALCVLSRSDYELGEIRKNIEEDNESYFTTWEGTVTLEDISPLGQL